MGMIRCVMIVSQDLGSDFGAYLSLGFFLVFGKSVAPSSVAMNRPQHGPRASMPKWPMGGGSSSSGPIMPPPPPRRGTSLPHSVRRLSAEAPDASSLPLPAKILFRLWPKASPESVGVLADLEGDGALPPPPETPSEEVPHAAHCLPGAKLRVTSQVATACQMCMPQVVAELLHFESESAASAAPPFGTLVFESFAAGDDMEDLDLEDGVDVEEVGPSSSSSVPQRAPAVPLANNDIHKAAQVYR